MPNPTSSDAPQAAPPHAYSGDEVLIATEATTSEGVVSASSPPGTNFLNPILGFLNRTMGIDRAVGFTVLARGWASVAGIVTLTLIARFLTPSEQGYYYTFYSLVAIQMVFELGFSMVVLQAASHEAAHLRIADSGAITGPANIHSRLASIFQKAFRWYTVAAFLLGAVLLPLGIYFFTRQGTAHPLTEHVTWFGPWLLVVFATMCTFQVDPVFSFLEGCGYVPHVARTRLTQAMLGSLMAWTALILHHGLYAPGCMILGQAIAGSVLIFSRRRLLLPLLRHACGEHRIAWRDEVWPFQWRIAVSWLSGYLCSQLFNPILFAYRGPVEAGQMGMSMNICNALTALSYAWMSTKAAPFGRMIALRNFTQLDTVFFRTLAQSAGVAVLAFTGVWSVVCLLRMHHIALSLRLLAPVPLAMLFVGTAINIVVFGFALYLRAHKQEKFMINSIASALYTIPAALLCGRYFGAAGIAEAYLAGALVIGLGFGSYTFSHWRRIWHG